MPETRIAGLEHLVELAGSLQATAGLDPLQELSSLAARFDGERDPRLRVLGVAAELHRAYRLMWGREGDVAALAVLDDLVRRWDGDDSEAVRELVADAVQLAASLRDPDDD